MRFNFYGKETKRKNRLRKLNVQLCDFISECIQFKLRNENYDGNGVNRSYPLEFKLIMACFFFLDYINFNEKTNAIVLKMVSLSKKLQSFESTTL